jgi:hypothetical protein
MIPREALYALYACFDLVKTFKIPAYAFRQPMYSTNFLTTSPDEKSPIWSTTASYLVSVGTKKYHKDKSRKET